MKRHVVLVLRAQKPSTPENFGHSLATTPPRSEKRRPSLTVEDMIEKGPDALVRYQPRMTYFFLDERRTKVQLTEDERNTIAALLALVQSHDGVELSQVVCLLVNSLREPENESLRQAFKSLILGTLAPELAPIAEIFDHPEEAMTASTFGQSAC